MQVGTEVNGTWTVTDTNGAAGSGALNDVTLPYAIAHALNGDTIDFDPTLTNGIPITLTSTLTIATRDIT